MLKKLTVLLICLILALTPVYAEETETFTGSVKNGKTIEITVSAPESINTRAFVYTYSVSGAGHCLIKNVEITDINAGEKKSILITPPEEGYSKKLIIAERFTLAPLCNSYVYPYMVNVYAESLGYRLLNVGTITEGGEEYSYNEYEITEFMQGEEEEEEVSVLSLALAANMN